MNNGRRLILTEGNGARQYAMTWTICQEAVLQREQALTFDSTFLRDNKGRAATIFPHQGWRSTTVSEYSPLPTVAALSRAEDAFLPVFLATNVSKKTFEGCLHIPAACDVSGLRR